MKFLRSKKNFQSVNEGPECDFNIGEETEGILLQKNSFNNRDDYQATNMSTDNLHEETPRKLCLQRLKEIHIVFKIIAVFIGIGVALAPFIAGMLKEELENALIESVKLKKICV